MNLMVIPTFIGVNLRVLVIEKGTLFRWLEFSMSGLRNCERHKWGMCMSFSCFPTPLPQVPVIEGNVTMHLVLSWPWLTCWPSKANNSIRSRGPPESHGLGHHQSQMESRRVESRLGLVIPLLRLRHQTFIAQLSRVRDSVDSNGSADLQRVAELTTVCTRRL